jgi:phenylacetyl-CoA:acceptor oxidoreductase subunit 2
MVATGLAEGGGLWLALSGRPATLAIWGGVALALVARLWLWSAWRDSLGAAPRALAAVARDAWPLKTGTLLALASAVLVAGLPMPGWAGMVLQVTAGAVAAAGGLWFKFSLLTRASFNQGFMLPHLPVRGVRPSGP